MWLRYFFKHHNSAPTRRGFIVSLRRHGDRVMIPDGIIDWSRGAMIRRPGVMSPDMCYTGRERANWGKHAMKIVFYQANFCAECGNPMKPRFSLGPRYFCDECA